MYTAKNDSFKFVKQNLKSWASGPCVLTATKSNIYKNKRFDEKWNNQIALAIRNTYWCWRLFKYIYKELNTIQNKNKVLPAIGNNTESLKVLQINYKTLKVIQYNYKEQVIKNNHKAIETIRNTYKPLKAIHNNRNSEGYSRQ